MFHRFRTLVRLWCLVAMHDWDMNILDTLGCDPDNWSKRAICLRCGEQFQLLTAPLPPIKQRPLDR